MDYFDYLAKSLREQEPLISISALAATVRTILSEDRRSIVGTLRAWALAGFVGLVLGLLLHDYFSASTLTGMAGVAGIAADDILMTIIGVSKRLRENPQLIIDAILRRKKEEK